MTLRPPLLCTILVVVLLGGCVSRDGADQKLAKGCEAGVNLFLTSGFKVKSIKESIFADDSELGKGYRRVTLKAIESDGWLDTDKEYRCIFVEEFGFLGFSHTAAIHQLKVDDKTFGKEGDKILGDLADHLLLTETVDKALNK